MSLDAIGEQMDWREAVDLARELCEDTSSHLAAAAAGWREDASLEALILMDIHDTLVRANATRRVKGRPRPWDRTRIGKATRTQREIRAALASRGH